MRFEIGDRVWYADDKWVIVEKDYGHICIQRSASRNGKSVYRTWIARENVDKFLVRVQDE